MILRVSPPLPPVAAAQETEAGPRVGLFFDDGSHVYLEASDPRADAFAAIAEELNR